MATYSLDSFSPDFWSIQEDDCSGSSLRHTKGRPTSVEAALWEMPNEEWDKMIGDLFPNHSAATVSVDDVITLIRETNICSGLDSPVEVWIDEEGDYCIKVYDK